MESELSVEISKPGKFFWEGKKRFCSLCFIDYFKASFVKMTVPFKKHWRWLLRSSVNLQRLVCINSPD